MTPPALSTAVTTRVAVVRALAGPGEVLCLVPALRALRAGRPDAHVTVVGVPSGRWLAERRPDLVDDWIDLPAWPGVHDADGEPGAHRSSTLMPAHVRASARQPSNSWRRRRPPWLRWSRAL